MAELPNKPVMERNPGIVVEEAMDVEKSASGLDRRDDNIKHMTFDSPETVMSRGVTSLKRRLLSPLNRRRSLRKRWRTTFLS